MSEDLKKLYSYNLGENLFDSHSKRVYYRLLECGYATYFVGGCIRDLLLGYTPNDFDVVTSARPKEINRVFHNSRKIGKRFQLVHVFFGKKNIEVATFRATTEKNPNSPITKKQFFKENNTFGTQREDSSRRDFTINALYYDLQKKIIIDYVDGVDDLKNHKVRTIGNPVVKLQEDPVRIIRAFKLATRLKFEIVPSLQEAITKYTPLLAKVPKARILFEILKILQSGFASDYFSVLAKENILGAISPHLQNLWDKPTLVKKSLANFVALDKICKKDKPNISDAVLLSLLCSPIICSIKSLKKLAQLATQIGIPNRLLEKINGIIFLQKELEQLKKISRKKCNEIVRNIDFVEALEFLKIRGQDNPKYAIIYEFWTRYLKEVLDIEPNSL